MEIVRERRGNALWLTINRPQARNALSRAVAAELVEGFQAAKSDPSVRAVVLTGAGDKAFCAGADLKDSAGAGKASAVFASEDAQNPLIAVFRAMRACPKPVIGRVNGVAMGGGLGLVSACDMVIAAGHAQFGTPEVKVGVFPMMITTYLIRQLPRRKYWEMAFLGEPLSAEEALRYQLVNYVVPAERLDTKVDEVVAKLEMNSPTALRMGKEALEVMQDLSVDQTMAYAQLMIERLSATDDAKEGMAAFIEKRTPVWPGR